MSHNMEAISQSWSAFIAVKALLCLAALVYIRGWLRLRDAYPMQLSKYRVVAFLAGISFIWIAIGSAVESFVHISLTVHMAQHLLLGAIAPPFILLGLPALPLLGGLPQSIANNVVLPFLRWSVIKRIGRFVTLPAISWLVTTFVLIGWHIPVVFEQTMRLHWLHDLQSGTFFFAGLLFWWPVIQPWPSRARCPRWFIPLYLFCATLPCDALSAFLAFCERVVYPSYLLVPRALTLTALQDQEFAAAVMWISVTIILLVPAAMITLQLLSPQNSPSDIQDHKAA